ncbi:inosine/xanthosine triphosphatase [Candidatus Curtissbacteria bacterium]|nr:inosine/xanthosine triphosphatase [Candidatus Curtissbacteria bacterium]
MKIAIGSKNPAKIRAAEIAFKKLFPKIQVTVLSFEVDPKVRSQPESDEECLRGAVNRARQAQKLGQADFGIGMEGGLNKTGTKLFECGWIAVVHKSGKTGLGSSARYEVPKSMEKLLKDGVELGEVIDRISGRKNVKHEEGSMGLLTNGHLPRDLAYSHGIIFAFAPFISKKYWK